MLRSVARMGQPQLSLGQRPRNEIKDYATPSPNGAAQNDDRRTYDMINTNCSALAGLNHFKESPSQGVALGFPVDGPLGRITEGSGSTRGTISLAVKLNFSLRTLVPSTRSF